MKRFLSILLNLWMILGGALLAQAEVTLPSLLSDGMVLQRDSRVKLWGKAKPGAKISIYTSWNGKNYSLRADASGPIFGEPDLFQG